MTRNTRRRIAMVAYTHYQTDPRCLREATLAASNGWEVHFYALSRDGRSHTTSDNQITLHELAMSRYRGNSSAAYILSYIRFLAIASWALQRAHMKSRFHVVHINTMPDFMVAAALLPRLFGAKVILDIHDVMPEIYMTKFRIPSSHWKIRLIKRIELLSARLAHRVLTAEHPKCNLLAEHGIPRDKIEVLLNLPDDELFPLQYVLAEPHLLAADMAPEDDFRLIYHGTITHRLGLDNAVEAMAHLRSIIPGATLSLIGEGDQLSVLKARVADLSLGNSIHFSDGFRPIREITPEIRAAHLAVIPTRHEVSTDYMLPTKLLEYLSWGIPAIFTPTKTVVHYFGDDHPLYLHDPTPEGTAKKILWARSNYADVKKLTASLQDRWFSTYYWPKHKHIYLDLIERLADSSSRHSQNHHVTI